MLHNVQCTGAQRLGTEVLSRQRCHSTVVQLQVKAEAQLFLQIICASCQIGAKATQRREGLTYPNVQVAVFCDKDV